MRIILIAVNVQHERRLLRSSCVSLYAAERAAAPHVWAPAAEAGGFRGAERERRRGARATGDGGEHFGRTRRRLRLHH